MVQASPPPLQVMIKHFPQNNCTKNLQRKIVEAFDASEYELLTFCEFFWTIFVEVLFVVPRCRVLQVMV
jgi:Ca2+-binding EF-hand superfamily protein